MQENTVTNEAGVPVLSKLPGVGSLFRHTETGSRKSELVILLRPQVIGSPADWEAGIDVSRQRIMQMAPQFQQDWRQF